MRFDILRCVLLLRFFLDGVAVFTMSEAGLMYEASVGGQKFTCEPAM